MVVKNGDESYGRIHVKKITFNTEKMNFAPLDLHNWKRTQP